jgi:hypothetical protein
MNSSYLHLALLFGSDICRQQVTPFLTLEGVGVRYERKLNM